MESNRTIEFSDRVSCPTHGPVMVLVKHYLGDKGREYANKSLRSYVTFFRCTGMVDVVIHNKDGTTGTERKQCTFMRPNKWQKRLPGERRK